MILLIFAPFIVICFVTFMHGLEKHGEAIFWQKDQLFSASDVLYFIEDNAKSIFSGLTKENLLRGLNRQKFIERLAFYMGEINALHPFREGNGRSAREYFRQLSNHVGYMLDFGNVDKDVLLTADIEAFGGNYTPLVTVLQTAVTVTPRTYVSA